MGEAEEAARKHAEEMRVAGIEEALKAEEVLIVKEIAVQAAKLLEDASRKHYERQVLLQKQKTTVRNAETVVTHSESERKTDLAAQMVIGKEAIKVQAEQVAERETARIESEKKTARANAV